MSGPMSGSQLGGMDLQHLQAAAKVARSETLMIRREVVAQMVDEILSLRAVVQDAVDVLGAEDQDYDEWTRVLGDLRAALPQGRAT